MVLMNIQQMGLQLPLETAGGVFADTPIEQAVFVAFDTETTGLSAVTSRLVELAGVKFTASGQTLSWFRSLINPDIRIPSAATRVHGISDLMVQAMPGCAKVVPEFIEWATDAESWNPLAKGKDKQTVLLAHNAGFDISFLEIALCRLGLPVPGNMVLDTLPMARQVLRDTEGKKQSFGLRALIERMGTGACTFHRALADSLHVQRLFCAMRQQLPANCTIGDLAAIAGKLHFFDRSQEEPGGRWESSPEVTAIRQAIDSGRRMRLQYALTKGSQRVVTPRSLLFAQGKPYLTAFCHRVSADRTFRIDKIIKLELLD
jgi:DNA polymerase-3 subunit epsilon